MTILVTGATGNIGRCVVDRLVGAGQRVRAMTRDPRTARLAPGVEVVYGDFERPDTWLDVLKGVERVYLFPFAYVDPDSGTSFVDQAVQAGVRGSLCIPPPLLGSNPATIPATGPSARCGGISPRNGRPIGTWSCWSRPPTLSGPM